jgi:diacylglycerol kinase (ATP)
VVIHPAKHDDMDGFRALVRKAMTELGWAEPLWLETRPDDTGERLAREAVRSGVDLVLASGGDGTVTACVSGVAGSGIPLGVLPCGTGNLLARNLGLPLSLDEALTVALTGSDLRLDVGTANGRPFVVMAGIGFDAEMLKGASEETKERMGPAAYVLSALRHLHDRPTRMVLRADGGPPRRRWASGVIIGNVGSLQGGVRLLPGAVPDDGVLDVAVLAARGWTGWFRLAADVLLRRSTGRLTQLTCRELLVDAGHARPWEVDGEVAGRTRQLRVTLQPGKLLLRVAATARRLAIPRFRVAAQQQDHPPLSELLGVVTQPCAHRRQRQLDEQRQGHRLTALARRRGHDIKPGVHHEQRCRRGRRRRQVPGPPEREVTRAGQCHQEHDVESRLGDVVVRGHLACGKRVPEVDDPGQQDQREQRECRARPPDHPRVVDQHGVLGLVGWLDKFVELVDRPLGAYTLRHRASHKP